MGDRGRLCCACTELRKPNVRHGWVREFYLIGEQKVRIRLSAGRHITRVELLRAERDIAFRADGRTVEFNIPSIDDYEVAALYSS
jgi:hypothetical protein